MVSVYKEHLRQLSIWGIVIFILVSAINILFVPFVLRKPFMDNTIIIDTEIIQSLYVGSMIIIILLTVRGFSFLNSRKACDVYHSLPIKRTGLYKSVLAAIITWIIISVLLPQTVFFIYYISMGLEVKKGIGIIVLWIAACFYMCAATSLCMAGSGKTGRGLFASLVLILVPRITILIVKATVIETWGIYDALPPYGRYNILNDVYCVGMNLFEQLEYYYSPDMEVLYYIISGLAFTVPLTIVFFILGAHAFKIRKSELAATYEMNKILKKVFLILLVAISCVTLAAQPAFPADSPMVTFGICVLVVMIAVFAFFCVETDRKYTKENNMRALKKLPILFGVMIVLTASTFVQLHFSKKQRVSADNTEYVIFDYSESDGITSCEKFIWSISWSYEDMWRTTEITKFTDKTIIEILDEEYDKYTGNERGLVKLDLAFNNGGMTYLREIYLDENGAKRLVERLCEIRNVEITEYYDVIGVDNKEAAAEIRDTLLSELKNKNLMDYLVIEKDLDVVSKNNLIREDGNGGYYVDLSTNSIPNSFGDVIRLHIDNTLPESLTAIRRYMEGGYEEDI